MRYCYISIIIAKILKLTGTNCCWGFGVTGMLHIFYRKWCFLRWNVYFPYDAAIPFFNFYIRVLFVCVHSYFICKIPILKTTPMFINCEWINRLGSTHTWHMSLSSKYRLQIHTVMLLRWYNSFLVSSVAGPAVLVIERISKWTQRCRFLRTF